jgi:hypothetical protein
LPKAKAAVEAEVAEEPVARQRQQPAGKARAKKATPANKPAAAKKPAAPKPPTKPSK